MQSYDEILGQGSTTGFGQFDKDYGILGTIGSLFTNPLGAWDEFLNGASNRVNYETAMQNLEYQRENLDYQKALQKEIFNREDTSYQRTVKDMRAAGLNPLTMTGTNDAGEAIATSPLHNDFQMQNNGLANGLSQLMNIANSWQNFQIGEAKVGEAWADTIGKWNDVTYNTDKDVRNWRKGNEYFNFQQGRLDTNEKWRREEFNRAFGTWDGMEGDMRDALLISNLLFNNNYSTPEEWFANGKSHIGYNKVSGEGLTEGEKGFREDLLSTYMGKEIAEYSGEMIKNIADLKNMFSLKKKKSSRK